MQEIVQVSIFTIKPSCCAEWQLTYSLLVFAELSDLNSLLFHPCHQPLQFSLQVLLLLPMLGCIDLMHQLLMLTAKKIQAQIIKCEKKKLNKTV